MLLCTRCKKRPAVVFVSNGMDSQNPQGLCLVCAKELGIKPVNDIMEKMGITDEELEAATEQMTQLMNLANDDRGGARVAPGGAATVGGKVGTARSAGGDPIARESIVVVKRIGGVKLIVEPAPAADDKTFEQEGETE